MIDGEYGDPVDLELLLARFDRWQHFIANVYDGPRSSRHDDLVQEGRIAMWLLTRDDRMLTASYLTLAAKRRMMGAITRDYWTGTEGTHGHPRMQPPTDSATGQENEIDRVTGTAGLVEGIELAYHRGEIHAAIDRLPVAQRRYVFARFWLGMGQRNGTVALLREITGREKPHSLWSGRGGAQERLRKDLSHLHT